jgi:acetyl esterase/lipase
MKIMLFIIQVFTTVLSCLVALASIPVMLRVHWPAPTLWIAKLLAAALSPLFAVIGVLGVIVGLTTGSFIIALIGTYIALFYLLHIYKVTRPPDVSSGFEQAFGLKFESQLSAEKNKHFLSRRTVLALPTVPIPRFDQNIPFATIPGTDRSLLCDVWQPNAIIARSGLAFIYLHGSAWALLDKDLGTRPFFKHLNAQGHVIMDVAYRLAHETDMMGMVNDAKRAIVWMKENAHTYGINTNTIVVGGGSAGGHLAMLAAFTANNPQFTPRELEGKDIIVCAVVSLYGPTDLKAMYYHTNQNLIPRSRSTSLKKTAPMHFPKWMIKIMGKAHSRFHFDKDFANAGVFASLLGGHPDECPEQYALFSPITHVHACCPPTLLIHGGDDTMAPVKSTRQLFRQLTKQRVPTVMHVLPQTDHAFDLILPKISPSAHSAFFDVERFLALQIKYAEKPVVNIEEIEEYQVQHHD